MDINKKIKELCSLAKHAGQHEIHAGLLEVREAMMEASAKQQLDLQFKDGAWYAEGDEIPYCPYCFEVHQLQVHMTCLYELEKGLYESNPSGAGRQWQCKHCKNEIRLAHGK